MRDQMRSCASKLVVVVALGLAVPGTLSNAMAAPNAPRAAVNMAVRPVARACTSDGSAGTCAGNGGSARDQAGGSDCARTGTGSAEGQVIGAFTKLTKDIGVSDVANKAATPSAQSGARCLWLGLNSALRPFRRRIYFCGYPQTAST